MIFILLIFDSFLSIILFLHTTIIFVMTISYKPILIGVTCTVAIASGASAYVWYENQRPPVLEIYVIPLKSGQAIFIRTPEDKRILIDGGPNSEIIGHISTILPFYSRRIDTVLLTKTDSNHVSGLVDMVERYDVGEVIVPAITPEGLGFASSSDQVYQTFLDAVDHGHIPLKKVEAGYEWIIDKGSISTSTVSARVLFPVSPDSFAYSKASGPELVLKISYGSTSVMLSGGITTKVQKFISSMASESSATSSESITSTTEKGIDVLVTSKSIISSNIATSFIKKFRPQNVIYSRAVSSVSKTITSPPKNSTVDPLAYLAEKNKFNIRSSGVVKIVSNGEKVTSISALHL